MIIFVSCKEDQKLENCPSVNNRKMPLIGVDKCGCLYAIPACNAPDCMWTVERKPCL